MLGKPLPEQRIVILLYNSLSGYTPTWKRTPKLAWFSYVSFIVLTVQYLFHYVGE